jgi:hypothetical protein
VTGFDNSDVSVSGGTLSAVTPDAGDPSGKTYKATFTRTAGVDATTATIQVAASGTGTSSWTDAAGNPGTASNTVSISEDTKAPTASSIAASGPGITNGNGDLNAGKVVTLTLSMSESVTVSGTPQLIPQRWRHGALYGRVRQQQPSLHLHRGGGAGHRRSRNRGIM